MKKIISLYQRNYDGDRLVRNEVVPGAEWVTEGEGEPTRKWDGTCVLIENGQIWKRHEVKAGKQPPQGFRPANDVDQATGKQQGWILAVDSPENRWHHEAFAPKGQPLYEDGTYELVGPKINGNPDHFQYHKLIQHGASWLDEAPWPTNIPRDYEGIKEWLTTNDIEGIVWHHLDGRMVKIKGKDFGLKRGQP